MTTLAILRLLLELAAFFARQAERRDIEKALKNEIENLHRHKVDAAADARDDVLSGRVPVDPDDPNRRD